MIALVVDDDASVRYTLRAYLEDAGLEVHEAEDGVVGLERIEELAPALVITDLRMPRLDGMGLLAKLAERTGPKPLVVMLTAQGSERHAVEAMKLGAFDYFKKPFDPDTLRQAIERAKRVAELSVGKERAEAERNLGRSLVFESASMSKLALLVQRVGPRDVTVLITGESGTGKERVAEAIVRSSARTSKPFVRFNCAAITADLAEAELFGHAKGAFTGAHRARIGLFREANGGTLLLDEIGELDARTQAKLLRVLQEGEVRPVGEERAVPIDVRILAATHRNLAELVTQGAFREDLLYRLKVVQLAVPPLRERPEDITLLFEHFLARAISRFGTGPLAVPASVLPRLCAHRWPGNVRELENAVESVVALSSEAAIDPELLPGPAMSEAPALGLKERIDAYERGILVQTLREAGQNRTEAARRLAIGRATLHEKLHKHGLE
jgi:two-component system response regulator HydG